MACALGRQPEWAARDAGNAAFRRAASGSDSVEQGVREHPVSAWRLTRLAPVEFMDGTVACAG
jgi:hypothetical protein